MDDETGLSSPTSLTDQDQASDAISVTLSQLPYACETPEDMHARLEFIVGRISVCAQAKNWIVLTSWDVLLQCWLLMRYPLSKPMRAKLVRLYYELVLVPGLEPRITRSWADMLSTLLQTKSGQRRKLEASDLQLPWRPLWRVLQKELWPKKRLHSSSRNLVNILLFVAELCRRYFPAEEIPEMLDTFVPLVTKDNILTMFPAILSFLPPTDTHVYLPPLFALWEAFNSAVIDERMLELAGRLSTEHVAGTAREGGGGTEWKDIGIWTEKQWSLLMGKGLASMNVPVGATRGASTTSMHADIMAGGNAKRIKKGISRFQAIAKFVVYSIAVDGPVRADPGSTGVSTPARPQTPGASNGLGRPVGFLAGSKALDSLDKMLTSTESFFHPSNSGPWTLALTSFLQWLASEFIKRWKEEEQADCKTPVTHRLTPAIRRAFVISLRTPALLAMFSKDPFSMAHSQAALYYLALLEPRRVMPELLARAYGGLEVVNETHRTTAVLSMLSAVSVPLVCGLGTGQRHVVALLELCIPGIDLNDPAKTVRATSFISTVVQSMKIGDLSTHQSGMSLTDEAPGEESMDVDEEIIQLPDGMEDPFPLLSKDEERALVRESSAAFADWVTSLFRRVLSLYENLPEEGGKKNTTGGKQEESMLSGIRSMLSIVCTHLSDTLFDLVLKLVYDYATTNAKSNSVKAFGQMVACVARGRPEQTLEKFWPFCSGQIREELKHGASSVRTTTSHAAVPSDTTLHWNIMILRGCFASEGAAPAIVKHKDEIVSLLKVLVDKTKSERGYSMVGRLIRGMLHTVAGIYPLNGRFVNDEEWNDPAFDKDHNAHWGKQYDAKDVKIEWHTPSAEDVQFVLNILDEIAAPALNKVEELLASTSKWDSIARNDFCRNLHALRSIWSGLPTIYQEHSKKVEKPFMYDDIEVSALLPVHLDVAAGFTLTDPDDPRYQTVLAHRTRFGDVMHRAAGALRQNTGGEDHIDAVLGVAKAIDVYLLDYAMSKTGYDSLQKNYTQSRDAIRVWTRQKTNTRFVFVRRAHAYHGGRVYMHALYRRRSALDDRLILSLVELCLSPYTRVRRHAQAVLHNLCGYYVRSTRLILPTLYDALSKGNDPDRMKGALYILWNKGTAGYALGDVNYHRRYLTSLLESQHEEKPSVQKLVGNLAQDCLVHLNEEAVHTDAYIEKTPGVEQALTSLHSEFSDSVVNTAVLSACIDKAHARIARRNALYDETVSSIVDIATRPDTHWRYVQMAMRFLHGLLRRDAPESSRVAKFLAQHTTSAQPTIRVYAQRAVVKLLTFVKARTYAKTHDELWLDEWKNPLYREVQIDDSQHFVRTLGESLPDNGCYVDKITTGFLTWAPTVKGYAQSDLSRPSISWDERSAPSLHAILETLTGNGHFSTLALLWAQESNRNGGVTELRSENVTYIKSLAKTFQVDILNEALSVVDSLIFETDRFKQRAAAEFIGGLLRGSKHWPKAWSESLWNWTRKNLDRIFAQIKPDTLPFFETMFSSQLVDRDPRRNQPLIDWIVGLPLDFSGDSAFAMNKTLSVFGIYVDTMGIRLNNEADKYVNLFFDNANTSYAEIRGHIAQNLYTITRGLWQPSYPSSEMFLEACQTLGDPLRIREAPYIERIQRIQRALPKWREERLPPPRVSQSEYDKVGLTVLQWIWVSSHGANASLIFPYVVPLMPDILEMSELNDSSDLQTYSSAVLYILSAVNPPLEYVEVILGNFVTAIKSSASWRIRLHALPALVVFFYRNLLTIDTPSVTKVMDVFLDCLMDENVEVREMASKALSGVVRCSQRQSIVPLRNRFVALARRVKLPARNHPQYAESLRSLHSAILGLCALIESFPYSVEPWMPSLTEILAPHATDPPPISTTIRKCASEFKKTHQDTWHKDQAAFNEDQIQSLSTMLVGTSYYA